MYFILKNIEFEWGMLSLLLKIAVAIIIYLFTLVLIEKKVRKIALIALNYGSFLTQINHKIKIH